MDERRAGMKKITYQCDACGKEALTIKTKLPIKIQTEDGVGLETHKVDLCRACANRISGEYYKICEEHNRSGRMGVRL